MTFVDLGTTPLANSYLRDAGEIPSERRFPLHTRVCSNCLLVQADDVVRAAEIFTDYAYFSSYADTWVAHARRYALAMIERFALDSNSLVVEVASNDGYLLQHFMERSVGVLGVEPATNVAAVARSRGIATETLFFGEATARDLKRRGVAADLMAANNVFAHVPDILDFAKGFTVLLEPEAVATFEFPHLLKLIEEVQFDTIYHEHYSYLSLVSVERILAAAKLRVFDCENLATHGGSLRLFVCHQDAGHHERESVTALRARETTARLDTLAGYRGFAPRVAKVRDDFLAFLRHARQDGSTIAAYGAAAKGNTFLNYCGLGADDIVCVFDRSLEKQGRLLPGSHIPIWAPDRIDEVKPDYLVILPWNLSGEIKSSMARIGAWGGRFVTAVPTLRVEAA
jgi:hypothetical protein